MLADYAVRVEQSRGRRHPEPQHAYRNDFQRDRDRVVHARAFRRLEAKTQVFTRRYSDHFRNRLTHTIELRLDWLADDREIEKFLRHLASRKPQATLIATCRRREAGGRYRGSAAKQLLHLGEVIEPS